MGIGEGRVMRKWVRGMEGGKARVRDVGVPIYSVMQYIYCMTREKTHYSL